MGQGLPGCSLTPEVRTEEESAVACACCVVPALIILAALLGSDACDHMIRFLSYVQGVICRMTVAAGVRHLQVFLQ